QVNGGTNERIFLNAYDDLGQLVEKQVGQIGTGALQHVDYKYNIRGWLTDINDVDPGHASGDLFSFRINYDTVQDDLDDEVSALYNGNISETFWRSSSDGFQRKYGYKYDGLNRLLHAYYQRPYENVPRSRSYDEWMAYDRNGNITSLGRNGDYEDLTAVQPIDDLVYTYAPQSNTLLAVEDQEAHASGFNDGNVGEDDYAYDTYGNMTTDKNKDIDAITYNHLNLPLKILYHDGSFITYQYNATGTKVRKLVSKQVGSNQEQTTTVYQQGFQYENNTLQFIAHPEGYIKATKINDAYQFNYVYQYKDHLGNIRMNYALDPSDNQVKILNEDHYYPFGLKHTNYNSNVKNFQEDPGFSTLRIIQVPSEGNTYRYKYNGKEWQDELGLNFYDYGARNYDPAIGRWMNIDPLADERDWLTPYNYVQNNPVVRIDPLGLTDFTFDKKTGDVKQIGEKNDSPDRILQTDKNGNIKKKGEGFLGFLVRKSERGKEKIDIDNIESGILKDGMNLKNDNVFEVGGENQPSVEGMENFILKLADNIDKELGGYQLSGKGDEKITHFYLGGYGSNQFDKGGTAFNLHRMDYNLYTTTTVRTHFHTHLTRADDERRLKPSEKDMWFKRNTHNTNPNINFRILTFPKSFNY
ncbi:RHS repeat-associated core domain-containing protein, partial [Flavobacterium sp. MAH-1]